MMSKFDIEKIGTFLILTPLVAFVIDICTFIMGGHITLINPLLSFFVILFYMKRMNTKWIDMCLYIVLSCIFLCVATVIYDYSSDGPWYHAKIVQLLIDGWNPIYNPFSLPLGIEIDMRTGTFWAVHYAKGMEMVGATFAILTNNMETAKAINLFFIVGSFMLVTVWLKRYLKGTRLIISSIVVTFNPIVVNQMFTGYIDWTSYTLLLVSIFSLLQLLHGRKEFAILYFLILFFVLSIKFNIAFWIVAFTFLFFCLFVLYTKCRFPKKIFLSSILVLILGLFVGGYNPYITNIEKHGNPFYPLIGEEKVEIMDQNELNVIKGKSRVEQVNISLLSNPNNRTLSKKLDIFGLNKENILSSIIVDARIGGFGIFFFEACALLLIGFVFMKKEKHKQFLSIFCLALYLSLFILPSGWWARYVSYFYLFPIILLYYNFMFVYKIRVQKWISYLASYLLLLDILISFLGVGLMVLTERLQVQYMLDLLSYNRKNLISTDNNLFAEKAQKKGVNIQKSTIGMARVDLLGQDVWVKKDFFEESKLHVQKPYLLSKISMMDLKYKED